MRDTGDKTQRPLFKGSHAHDGVLDFVDTVNGLEKSPIVVVAVFQNLLDYVAPVLLGVQRIPVRIPEQVLRELAEIDIGQAHARNIHKFRRGATLRGGHGGAMSVFFLCLVKSHYRKSMHCTNNRRKNLWFYDLSCRLWC